MTAYPIDRPLPGHARPQTPDPADAPAGVDEDECAPCDRRSAHHQCTDYVRYGACCCGTLERLS